MLFLVLLQLRLMVGQSKVDDLDILNAFVIVDRFQTAR